MVDDNANAKQNEKTIKIMFYIRVCLWITALIATIYWIYWSFELYNLGYYDEHQYAVFFRPIFAKGLLISLVAICISFILRKRSDNIKDKAKQRNMESPKMR